MVTVLLPTLVIVLGIADGFVQADGQQIYEVSGLKVGLVQDAAAVPAAAS